MSATPKPRCPKHGTVLIPPSSEYPEPWCWPCWNVDHRWLPGPDVEGGRLAMSRFLVFVWMEADYRAEPAGHVTRADVLRVALDFGLLRLDWRRP